jgi:hypothetical protein
MLIACLGWGSLVWDPRELPVRREWFADGPLLPIEFARKSGGDRVTLVLLRKAPLVRSLWTLMSVEDLQAAKEALADREGMRGENKTKDIGYWSLRENSGGVILEIIAKWASNVVGIEAVIWTDLAPTFSNEYNPGLADKVIAHLRCPTLSHEKRQYAEQYIRRAPKQIDTEVRRKIEQELGWLPQSICRTGRAATGAMHEHLDLASRATVVGLYSSGGHSFRCRALKYAWRPHEPEELRPTCLGAHRSRAGRGTCSPRRVCCSRCSCDGHRIGCFDRLLVGRQATGLGQHV